MANAKIVAVIQSLGGGGAERICVTLCNGFIQEGRDVELIVLDPQGAVFNKKLNKHVQLNFFNAKRARYAIFKLMKYVREEKPQSLLVFNYHVALMIIIIKCILRSKTKIIVRNISTLSLRHKNDTFLRSLIFSTLTKLIYKKADQIIAQSYGMKDDLIKHYKVPEEKCVVIYNPISAEIENYKDDMSTERNYFLCIGRLEKVKAFDYAVKAFAEVQKIYPHSRLKFVGSGSKEEALKDLCRSLNISDNVDFENFSDDVIPYYTQAKATLLTSLYEGFPNVLIESISLGTPILAFDCQSGPSEIIKENINGYLVRYQDIAHLVECMKKAWVQNWNKTFVQETGQIYRAQNIVKEYLDILEK